MPNLDRKGPNSNGARSGRGLGKCNPENKGKTAEEILQGNNNQAANSTPQRNGFGNGQGNGQGRGQGKGNGQGRGQSRRSQ
ncbi:MAG: hypothetical protein KA397_06165 [Paludibacteraceae bacterium]|nr:hypothetical protein [Paludibacteraceae bacterium]MBP6284191.1 hypothetical protein [Paludibacteraceae bacterium]